jgi:hypothetical protein
MVESERFAIGYLRASLIANKKYSA